MGAAAPALPARFDRMPIPGAAFEILAYFVCIAAAALAFLAGWLTIPAAAVLTVGILVSLIVLSWIHLGQGRHPVFLLLCTLALFQGGRLIAYCFGALPDPMAIELMVDVPFTIPRDTAGLVLLSLALSAVCIYAPCRWKYRYLPPPSNADVRRYLPYLYFLYCVTFPFLLYKNYLYLQYIQSHGGYLVFFSDYSQLVSGVPFVARVMALFPLPVMLAIFVFESRKSRLWFVLVTYFGGTIVLLLTGTRLLTFSLVLALWYLARIKSSKPPRKWLLLALLVLLIVVGNIIALVRFGEQAEAHTAFDPVHFVATQGISLNVTEAAFHRPDVFRPYVLSYLFHELQVEFVASDVSNYFRGRQFGYDVSVYLNAREFTYGIATASSFLGMSFLMGGVFGVVAISFLVGLGLDFLYRCSGNVKSLLFVAIVLPQVLLLPRGFLLGWASSLIRTGFLFLPILIGWMMFHFLVSAFPRPSSLSPGVNLAGS